MKAAQRVWTLSAFLVLAALACALPGMTDNPPVPDLAPTQTAMEATGRALEAQLSAVPPTRPPTRTPAPTEPPTATEPPPPSPTPKATSTPSGLIPNCTRWDRLDRDMVGKTMCVYGVITRISTGTSQSMIFEDRNAPQAPVEFRFLIINAWYPRIKVGMCIRGEGELRENGPTSYLFINTGTLWTYKDPSMCDE